MAVCVCAHMHHAYGYYRYATESAKILRPQDADTQPGWAELQPMGSIWGVKIQVKFHSKDPLTAHHSRAYHRTHTNYADTSTQSLLLTLRGAGFSDGLQHLDVYYKPHNSEMNNRSLPVRKLSNKGIFHHNPTSYRVLMLTSRATSSLHNTDGVNRY